MSKANEGELQQIVDFDGNFICDLDRWMSEKHLKNVGFDYSVVTILGTQSSGKSTLLNALFGTSFQVMNSAHGHSQTTKGLWISVDTTLDKNNIIIDVEGTDSKERGDQRLTFEHRAALFSLALADCVVVNIWYSSLGCYTASNYSLLKTVIEVNLELFQQQKDAPKTVLLFVVRDWSPLMTPLDVIKNKIKEGYINAIWKEINKPQKLENSFAEEFFTFEVVGLAHRIMSAEQFDSDIKALQKTYLSKLRPRVYSRQIPSDGFPTYCLNIWETIKNQSQLDIPSQKEMLSSFRCQEIKTFVFNELKVLVEERSKEAEASDAFTIPFSEFSSQIISTAIEMYMGEAFRYQADICEKIKIELIESLCIELAKVAEAHLIHLKERLSLQFTTEIENFFKSKRLTNNANDDDSILNAWENFNTISEKMQQEKLHIFDSAKKKCQIQIKDFVKVFDFKTIRDHLKTSMLKDVSRICERQQAEFFSLLQSSLKEDLNSITDLFMQRDFNVSEFWNFMKELIIFTRNKNCEKFKNCFYGLHQSRKMQKEHFENVCAIEAFKQLKIKLQNIVADIHTHIINRFQKLFSYDENDQPRQWNCLSVEKLSQIYLKAKDNALVLLDCLSDIKVDISSMIIAKEEENSELEESLEKFVRENAYMYEGWKGLQCKNDKVRNEECGKSLAVNANLLLLSDMQRQTEREKAISKMQMMCKEAQFMQTAGGTTSWQNIPFVFWLIFFLFSYNEVYYLFSFFFSSWILLPFFLVVAIVFIFAHYSGNMQNLVSLIRNASLFIKMFVIPYLSRILLNIVCSLQPQQNIEQDIVDVAANSLSKKEAESKEKNQRNDNIKAK